jgi:hypothetical protein
MKPQITWHDLKPGQVWGDKTHKYLIIQYDEGSCNWRRMVNIEGDDHIPFTLCSDRNQEITDYFARGDFKLLANSLKAYYRRRTSSSRKGSPKSAGESGCTTALHRRTKGTGGKKS